MVKCTGGRIDFGRPGRRAIEVDFSGGDLSSDGGLMLVQHIYGQRCGDEDVNDQGSRSWA